MKSTELLNTKVIHKMLGEGIITEAGDNYVTVKFASKVSRFIFPIAFEKFITAENSDIQEMIIEEINRARNEEHKKQAEKEIIHFTRLTMYNTQTRSVFVYLYLSASTQQLINPIIGLTPKFSTEDFKGFVAWKDRKTNDSICRENKDFIISLANLLYKIELNDRDKKLLWKSLRKNKKMLKSMDISKKEFDMDLMNGILDALRYSCNSPTDRTGKCKKSFSRSHSASANSKSSSAKPG